MYTTNHPKRIDKNMNIINLNNEYSFCFIETLLKKPTRE